MFLTSLPSYVLWNHHSSGIFFISSRNLSAVSFVIQFCIVVAPNSLYCIPASHTLISELIFICSFILAVCPKDPQK